MQLTLSEWVYCRDTGLNEPTPSKERVIALAGHVIES